MADTTHFPFPSMEYKLLPILSFESEKVEEAQNTPSQAVHTPHTFSVFYISYFQSTAYGQVMYVWVCEMDRMTVGDYLERYNPFIDDFTGCKQMSWEEPVNLRREHFGLQSLCEVHRMNELLKLGKSVCQISDGNVCLGTGFVLFDHYILTNAHLQMAKLK